MTMRKAMKTTTTMETMAMAMMMMMMELKRTPTLNVSNGYDGREEIDANLGMGSSVDSNSTSNIRMRGERRRRRNRRRGGRVDVTMRRCRTPRSAGLGIARDVTQNRRGLVVTALRLETEVQQVLGATRSSRMGRALAWNGAGGPPMVDQPCAEGEEGVAELQGRRLGHRRRGRVDMGCGGGGGGVGEASGAAPAVEAWQQQQQRVKKTCYVGEGFRRWQCSVWSPPCGW